MAMTASDNNHFDLTTVSAGANVAPANLPTQAQDIEDRPNTPEDGAPRGRDDHARNLPSQTHESHQSHRPALVGLTLIENAMGPATKVFSLADDGALIIQSAAQIYEGRARLITVSGIHGLAGTIWG